MLLKSPNKEKIKIIDRLALHWIHLGVLLDSDEVTFNVADREHRGDPKACCQAIFQHWLKGYGRKPISWRTLIELLENLKQKLLADEIQNALKVFLVV